MQYVRHLLIDNCWLGWWCGKSDLQCLELSRRQIKHVGSHSRVVSFNTIFIVNTVVVIFNADLNNFYTYYFVGNFNWNIHEDFICNY